MFLGGDGEMPMGPLLTSPPWGRVRGEDEQQLSVWPMCLFSFWFSHVGNTSFHIISSSHESHEAMKHTIYFQAMYMYESWPKTCAVLKRCS